MKTSALLPLLLLVLACASRDGFIDEVSMECGPGQEVTIQAGLDAPSVKMERVEDQLTLLVEVSNNSHREIVVEFIRGEQVPDELQQYKIQNGYRKFDHPIEEGASHTFKIPMTGRMIGSRVDPTVMSRNELALNVTVGLTNGNVYRCRFGVRQPA
jgi:hypothetical protein